MGKIDEFAKIVWDYLCVDQPLQKADAILALGSHDVRVAERAADIFLAGFAPYIIFSGGIGRLTQGIFEKPEADLFTEIAVKKGVPEDKIIIENQSTNTGENIKFTKKLLDSRGLSFDKFILIQKPYMTRRAYATFEKNWPGKKLIMTSPQIAYENYPNEIVSKDEMIDIMVGDLQRIKEYPKVGFQICQEIPDKVWNAYKELVLLGYDKQLIK